jgi:hypothetical protein
VTSYTYQQIAAVLSFESQTGLILSCVGVVLFFLSPSRQLQDITFIYTKTTSFHILSNSLLFSPLWRCGPTLAMAFAFTRFLDHTQRRTTVGRTPLDEWSARRRDLYLATRNTHKGQTPMPKTRFEPTTSAGERPQTHALECAATGTGFITNYLFSIFLVTECLQINEYIDK